MKEFTSQELDCMYSLLSKELEDYVSNSHLIVNSGYQGRPMHQRCEEDIAQLRSCLAKLTALNGLAKEAAQ